MVCRGLEESKIGKKEISTWSEKKNKKDGSRYNWKERKIGRERKYAVKDIYNTIHKMHILTHTTKK